MSDIPPPTVPPATPPPPGGGSYTPPPPPPPTGGGMGGPGAGPANSDRTLMIILAYLWILALIPLLTKKDDPDVQWHAKNGLAFTIAEVAFWVIFQILMWVLPSGMAGCGLGTLGCIIWVAFIAIHVLGIVKGVNGQRFRLPVISDFADKM